MARVPSHLILRNGVYNYRRRVPADLRSNPVFRGRDTFQVSLGVRTLVEARQQVALRKLDELFHVEHPATDEAAERTALTPALLAHIAKSAFERSMTATQRDRLSDPDDVRQEKDEWAAQQVSALNDPIGGLNTREHLRRELAPVLQIEAEAKAREFGLSADETNLNRIAGALFDAEVGAIGARVDFASGKAVPTMPAFAHASPSGSAIPLRKEAHWTFKKLAQAAMRQHPKGDSWEHKVTTVAKLFDDYVGAVPIYKIDRRKVRDFMNDIQFMPDRMAMRFPDLSLKDAIKANDARETPYRSISPNTARDGYFSIIRWVFNHALELEAIATNPCTGIRISGATKAKGKRTRNPFTVAELNAFFRLPLFTGCLSEQRPNTPGKYTFDDHRKWAPLVLLFSGARPSEVAQLAVADIKSDGPHPYISILTEYDPEDPEDERDFVVSHKTENARRNIPIHPQLIDLGFLSYVQRRKDAGDERLFPGWKLSGDGRKLYSSASWIRSLNEKQIPAITMRRPKPTLYSFRHTWKTQMAICGVPTQYQNQILGHAQSGMDEHYLGRMDIEHTYKAISRVSFDKLDLDHLKSS
ncbi:site-specific integrase [Brevundimonas guildfordensis]|uniref:Site-specific integrase n=1 Tax=Brevundimonas guildfordensis TaxID=2762241 RepID=A0ABR8QXF0_9CAUL|nr:site-specific integrase [Brevundimonas guildfordensis]MBD7940122.1 site-specific integrase [Brevundimonas guildfordensis]